MPLSDDASGDSRAAAGVVNTSSVKEVRQQPNGLRIRFWPVGFEEPGIEQERTNGSNRHRSEHEEQSTTDSEEDYVMEVREGNEAASSDDHST